jgi:hypothetical protein
VPETATRLVEEQSHHTGRGGRKLLACPCSEALTEFDLEGNVHHIHEKEHPSDAQGLADKLKHKIIGDKKDN